MVLLNIESKEIAERIIKRTTNDAGRSILQPTIYQNNDDDLRRCIFYEPVPADATLEERSVYFNPKKLTTEPVEGYPKRTD